MEADHPGNGVLIARLPTIAEFLDFAVAYYDDESPCEVAERVLATLTPRQIRHIAIETLIQFDPATDYRSVAKEELAASVEALDWRARETFQ